jgi:superfamily II DNA/RNA helicase
VFDVEYGYSNAIQDEAVINLLFQPMELNSVSYKKNGEHVEKNCFENGTDTFVALCSGYGKKILDDGLNHWQDYRLNVEPRSKCIIVCASQDECRNIRDFVNQRGLQFALAISDETKAHENIERFKKDNNCNVLITCQMAYEGLDCIQATHLICLSLIRSLPFLVQMFTRVMRFDRYSNLKYQEQTAYAFVPTDEKMNDALAFISAKPLHHTSDDLNLLFPSLDFQREPVLPSIIENMKSSGSGFGQVDPVAGRELTPEIRQKVQLWQYKNKIKANELDTYEFLQKRGLLHELDETKSLKEISIINAHDVLSKTPREREVELRNKINKLASKADYQLGLDQGTWNKKAFNKFVKSRKDMSEKELKKVHDWLRSEIIAECDKQKMISKDSEQHKKKLVHAQ